MSNATAKMCLVRVIWIDAVNRSGWQDVDDAAKEPLALCETVGWLVRRDRKALRITGTRQGDDVLGVTVIPAGWIKKIERIRS